MMNDKEFEPRAAVIEKIKILVADKKKTHGVSESAPAAASVTPAATTLKAGRNDPCPCGSGKKYKKCCALKGASHE